MKPLLCLIFLAVLSPIAANADTPSGRYKDILDRMEKLRGQYPDLTRIFSIGTNDEGVEIFAIRVSVAPAAVDPKKIGQIVVSTHHGNEDGAPLFTMRFLETLLERYRGPELWRGKLADMEWTIIPVLNISGYNAGERREHDIDPNRDYASPCTTEPGGKLKSVQRLLALLETRRFVGSVTVHGYDGSLTYPWGMHADDHTSLDANLYHSIFGKAASHNQYRYGNGAELVYPANGCYEDYVYWKYGSWSMLLELLDGSPQDIERTVPAIFRFFEELDSSPSVKNQWLGHCTKWRGMDLRVE